MPHLSKRTKRKISLGVGIALVLVFALRPLLRKSSDKLATSSINNRFEGLGEEGSGGDPDFNRLKNRARAPEVFEDLSIQNVLVIPSALFERQGRSDRRNWSEEAREEIAEQEKRAVRISGYFVRVKQSGKEAANGNIDSLRDYHLWLADSPDAEYGKALVVEITPRLLALHPEWKLRYLRALAKQHAHIRVTGYLLWDGEHGNEVGHSRASLWEVHPVTGFEVFNDGKWQTLETPSRLVL